jgi:hypothetical protein
MSDLLRSVEVVHVIWAIPLFQLIHEVEEWNILRWYRENYVDLPGSSNLTVRLWIIVFSLFVYVWTTISFFIPNATVAMTMIVLLLAVTAQNGLQHVYWLFRFRRYAPGVITSVVLVLPLDGYITYRILREELLASWLVLIVFVLMLPGLVETVRAGNRMTKTVRVIVHELPIRLLGRLST